MLTRRVFLLGSASWATLGLPITSTLGAQATRRRQRVPARDPDALVGAAIDASNVIWLRDSSGRGAQNHPVQIGRPFVMGEIAEAPQVAIDGNRVPTQANVKVRWPDGSVKHAVLFFVLPEIPANGAIKISFLNQPTPSREELRADRLRDSAFDFEVAMQIAHDGRTETVSARKMLLDRSYTVWCDGPIATTLVLADHTRERKYDIGFDAKRSIRPIFHATFWHGLGRVRVRAIGENSNTETLQDISYSLVLKPGMASPIDIFRQDEVPNFAGTRWTRSFWIGEAPNPQISIDHNVAYLGATRLFPRFDPSIRVAQRGVVASYERFMKRDRSLFGDGGWQKNMPSTGGRGDIGPYTSWTAQWLLSGGDYRMFEVVSTMADLACAWPMHVREGNPAKKYDKAQAIPALGRPVSVYARPSLWLFDNRGGNEPEDAVPVAGSRLFVKDARGRTSRAWGGWRPDGAHQPEPFAALYTLTGDPFYLEQLQFWSAANVVSFYNPGYKPPFPSGALTGPQTRSVAWELRSRIYTADLSPDGSPEKAYFTGLTEDAIACLEGRLRIRGTRFEGTPLWQFGATGSERASPLHFFRETPRADLEVDGDPRIKPGAMSATSAIWQQYLLIFVLGIARERGFDTAPLLAWTGKLLTSQFQEPGYDPHNLARYTTAVKDEKGIYFPTWTATLSAYVDSSPPAFRQDVCDGYPTYAYGAVTMLTQEPGGQAAYEWLRQNFYEPRRSLYERCPKWAYLPRN